MKSWWVAEDAQWPAEWLFVIKSKHILFFNKNMVFKKKKKKMFRHNKLVKLTFDHKKRVFSAT